MNEDVTGDEYFSMVIIDASIDYGYSYKAEK
jgi:hypothetical protein